MAAKWAFVGEDLPARTAPTAPRAAPGDPGPAVLAAVDCAAAFVDATGRILSSTPAFKAAAAFADQRPGSPLARHGLSGVLHADDAARLRSRLRASRPDADQKPADGPLLAPLRVRLTAGDGPEHVVRLDVQPLLTHGVHVPEADGPQMGTLGPRWLVSVLPETQQDRDEAAAATAFGTISADGVVRALTGAAGPLLGRVPSGLIGIPLSVLMAGTPRHRLTDALAEARRGRPALLPITVTGADGRPRPLHLTLYPSQDGLAPMATDPDALPVRLSDATPADADSAEERRARWLAGIGHEARTPVNLIMGFADLLSGETFGPLGHPQYKHYLALIQDSGRALKSLVGDLLAAGNHGSECVGRDLLALRSVAAGGSPIPLPSAGPQGTVSLRLYAAAPAFSNALWQTGAIGPIPIADLRPTASSAPHTHAAVGLPGGPVAIVPPPGPGVTLRVPRYAA